MYISFYLFCIQFKFSNNDLVCIIGKPKTFDNILNIYDALSGKLMT